MKAVGICKYKNPTMVNTIAGYQLFTTRESLNIEKRLKLIHKNLQLNAFMG